MWDFLSHIFFGGRRLNAECLACGPKGRLLYAVGDVHGRADLLEVLLAKIRLDAGASLSIGRPIITFLGDYVDRGPSSRQVIDIILRTQADGQFELCALRGNHDQFLLDFIEDGRGGSAWLSYGGDATLRSYGVALPAPPRDSAAYGFTAADLRARMPKAHRNFLEGTVLTAEFGNYVLVHAGVRPNIELEQQSPQDLLSIRKQFLDHSDPMPGRTVIFGHSPFSEPLVRPEKIGLDTGAYATGVLTALKIFEADRRIIQARDAKFDQISAQL